MELEILPQGFSVCKVKDFTDVSYEAGVYFIGKTERECSLVCETAYRPKECLKQEDGWRGFRIKGELDFSLTGILSKISSILAEAKIGIFAVSTYDTDYVFVKEEGFAKAVKELKKYGYTF